MDSSRFALFVRPVVGQPVTRYGTTLTIGARRDRKNPRAWVWDEQTVVALSVAEYARFRREYDRALQSGALIKASAEQWREQNAPPTVEAPPVTKRKERKK